MLVALTALLPLAARAEPHKPPVPAGLAQTHELSSDERAAARGRRTATANPIAAAAPARNLRIGGQMAPFVGDTRFGLPIPFNLRLVGARLSAQALAMGTDTCLGQAHLSDTLDFAIR